MRHSNPFQKSVREIFDEALRCSGCTPDEAGIRPMLLLRGRMGHDDVENANDLLQTMELIFKIN